MREMALKMELRLQRRKNRKGMSKETDRYGGMMVTAEIIARLRVIAHHSKRQKKKEKHGARERKKTERRLQ